MIYVSILLMLFIMYGIEYLDNKREARSTKSVEETQQKLYDLIDEHFGDTPACARERKAEVDMMIKQHWDDLGREYKPENVKQVTTAEERSKRSKAMRNGTYTEYRAHKLKKAQALDAIDDAIDEKLYQYDLEHEKNSGKEYFINKCMSNGDTYEVALGKYNNVIAFANSFKS